MYQSRTRQARPSSYRLLRGLLSANLSAVKELDQAAAKIAAAVVFKQHDLPTTTHYLQQCLSELLHAGIIEIGPEYHDL